MFFLSFFYTGVELNCCYLWRLIDTTTSEVGRKHRYLLNSKQEKTEHHIPLPLFPPKTRRDGVIHFEFFFLLLLYPILVQSKTGSITNQSILADHILIIIIGLFQVFIITPEEDRY